MAKKVEKVTDYASIVRMILIALRKEKRLPQSEIAEKLSLNVSTWSRIEQNKSALTIEQLAIASECLGVTPDAILQMADNKVLEMRETKGIDTLSSSVRQSFMPPPIEESTLANAMGKISLFAVAALATFKVFDRFKK